MKPLSMIQRMLAEGRYLPYCLFDGETRVGECFLWRGDPGWTLLDYLCVTPGRRNEGLGARMLEMLRRAMPECTIFGEAEVPEFAPEPETAERRLGFYRRCGARFAGFLAQVFTVPYTIFYWSEKPIPDETLMPRYAAVYRGAFRPDQYARFVRIPWTPTKKKGIAL